MDSVLLLLPDFALVLLGFGLRRRMHLGDHFWSGLEKLVYYVLFPALLFNALVRTHIDFTAAAPLIASGLAAMAAGMALGGVTQRMLTPVVFASRFQCAFRFNSYIGLAVAGKLHGAPGVAAMGIVIGALPAASSAHILAMRMGGDGAGVAFLISASTLLAMLTLPVWLLLLAH